MNDTERLEWVRKNWESQEFHEIMTTCDISTLELFREVIDQLIEDQLK